MINQHITTSLRLKAVSISDFRSADSFHLNDGTGIPVGMSIPVAAGNKGFTISYYTRRFPSPGYDFGFKELVSSTPQLNVSLNSQQQPNGNFEDVLFYDGRRFPYGPGYMYDSSSWVLITMRTLPGLIYPDGRIYLNTVYNNHNPYQTPTRINYAYICLWDRSLSDAEIAQSLMPTDYIRRYTAIGYKSDDISKDDDVSGGALALFHF